MNNIYESCQVTLFWNKRYGLVWANKISPPSRKKTVRWKREQESERIYWEANVPYQRFAGVLGIWFSVHNTHTGIFHSLFAEHFPALLVVISALPLSSAVIRYWRLFANSSCSLLAGDERKWEAGPSCGWSWVITSGSSPKICCRQRGWGKQEHCNQEGGKEGQSKLGYPSVARGMG